MTKQLCDSSVIANNARKTQKLIVQGYNLEVHDVIKYMRKHRATVLNGTLIGARDFGRGAVTDLGSD